MNKVILKNLSGFDASVFTSFCEKYNIKKLSFFGSVLYNNYNEKSDIDILIEFEKDKIPGLLLFTKIESELSEYFNGRKIDLRTSGELSPYFRDEVIKEAVQIYG
jgi:predicted nucleotidyltransferase